jgi:hypothetical protein
MEGMRTEEEDRSSFLANKRIEKREGMSRAVP